MDFLASSVLPTLWFSIVQFCLLAVVVLVGNALLSQVGHSELIQIQVSSSLTVNMHVAKPSRIWS